MTTKQYDIAIIGAGLAGLTCARQLQKKGYKTIILDKSRGVGGRVATRRINHIPVDRGLPFIQIQGKQTEKLIQKLCQNDILQPWTDKIYDFNSQKYLPPADRYIALQGMTAIAKYLAADLEIQKQSRVTAIAPTPRQTWELTYDSHKNSECLHAKAVIIAIPAPQALALLEPLSANIPTQILTQLRSVTFHPCLAVMAGYSIRYQSDLPQWQGMRITDDPDLAWIAIESSNKQTEQTVVVLHDTPHHTMHHLNNTNLQLVGQQLLSRAANLLLSWLDSPEWFQVHRWRYARPNRSLEVPYLATTQPLPLICCGDWCNGNSVESVLLSGLASAEKLSEFY
jgi:predicted NAD/FAD-dependent oxidoreductase